MATEFHGIRYAAITHADLREQLKQAFGLDDDDQVLADTLEGESAFVEILAAALRECKAKEAMAEGLKGLIADMQTRKARLEHTAERIRQIVADAMLEAGERKLALDDMTVSVRQGKPKIVPDIERLPDRYKVPVLTFKPNKDAIQEAVDRGDVPEGVTITNGSASLTIRVR